MKNAQEQPPQQPYSGYDEFFLDLVQDDLNRKLFHKTSLDSLAGTSEKSANLNAKYYGQTPQTAGYQQNYYNQMAGQIGTIGTQDANYMQSAQSTYGQSFQQPSYGTEKISTLSAMQPNMMSFMTPQQATYDPNMLMQQMSNNFITI